MGPKTGIKFGIPAELFPRYFFHQKRLRSIVPRFISILEYANLSSCISEGKVRLAEITDSAKRLDNRVKVTVVGGNNDLLESFESEVRVVSREHFSSRQEWTSWMKVMVEIEKSSRFDPYFLVYLMENPTKEMVLDLEGQFSSLTEDQLRNILIYDTDSKKNYIYTDCLNENGPELPSNKRMHSLSQQIQYLLEDRVIEVLEKIVIYARNFAPRPGVDPDQSLLDECSTQVLESISNQHMLDDLSPEFEFEKGKGTEPSPGSSDQPESMTKIKAPRSTDVIFHEKLMDFMFRKTKCIICDHLAKKYGINSSLVNELMNKEYCNYEMKYRSACEDLYLPPWSDVKKNNKARLLNYNFVLKQSTTILETETYIREKMEVLTEIAKLVFEINALLRDTVVPVSLPQPTYPKLAEDLQDKLLDFPEVTGCGTVYGKLTLHTNKDLSFSSIEYIKELLQQYKYPHSYEVQVVQDPVKQAGPTAVRIECGNELQAKLTPEGQKKMEQANVERGKETKKQQEKTGTLGCYVKLSKQREDSNTACGENVTESGLYAVTCAHCVTDCYPNIQVKMRNKLVDLGVTENIIDDGQRVDIAVVKVNPDQVRNCETYICPFNKDWILYDGLAGDHELGGKVVFKRGSMTNQTEGIISCNNFRMKRIADWNASSKHNFNKLCNILIDVEPGSDPGAAFSRAGDSGSTAWYELNSPDGLNTTIVVVSLVQGSMSRNNKYHCTYSCHMKHSLEELCAKHGYKLEYPDQVELLFTRQGRSN